MTPAPDDVLRPEGDHVPRAAFWLTGALCIAIVVASVFIAGHFFHSWSRSGPEAPPLPARAQVGIVEQTLIERTERGLDARAAQRETLTHFGWVDRSRGLAKIPIDQAMDLATDPVFLRRAFPEGGAK
jgi:hypothetical protein